MPKRDIETDWALDCLESTLEYRETDSSDPNNTQFWTREHHTVARVRLAPLLFDDTGLAILGPQAFCCGTMQTIPGGTFKVTGDDSQPGDALATHYIRAQTLERYTKWRKLDFSPTVVTFSGGGYKWGLGQLCNSLEYRTAGTDTPNAEEFQRRKYSRLTRWVNEWTSAPSLALGAAVAGPVTRRDRADHVTPGGLFVVTCERYSAVNASRDYLRREQTLERYGQWSKERFVFP